MAAQHHIDESGVAGAGPEAGLAGERELWQRFTKNRDQSAREELVRRNMDFAKRLALRYRGATRVPRRPAPGRQHRPPQRRRPIRPRPRHTVHGIRLADDPRRAQTPLSRPGLDRARTARAPRSDGGRRQGDHRADQGAAALALGRPDRRAPGTRDGRRPRGPRGKPQPPAAFAGSSRRRATTPRKRPRRSGSATRTRTSSWSRVGSPSTPLYPSSTSVSGWF